MQVPKIMSTPDESAVGYIGYINMSSNFPFYSNIDQMNAHKYRVYTAGTPFAYSDMTTNENGNATIYLFNLGEFNPLKKLMIRAVFENPQELLTLDPDALDREYPAPGSIQEDIITRLSERYIRYYRQLNILPQQVPNIGADSIT
jgi:hypothetical protein